MTETKSIRCAYCRELLKSEKFFTQVDGKQRLVCSDCADGVQAGARAMLKAHVVGVFIGDCPDNRKGAGL